MYRSTIHSKSLIFTNYENSRLGTISAHMKEDRLPCALSPATYMYPLSQRECRRQHRQVCVIVSQEKRVNGTFSMNTVRERSKNFEVLLHKRSPRSFHNPSNLLSKKWMCPKRYPIKAKRLLRPLMTITHFLENCVHISPTASTSLPENHCECITEIGRFDNVSIKMAVD